MLLSVYKGEKSLKSSNNLTGQQEKAARYLVDGYKPKDVAGLVGVHPETLNRWGKNPYFKRYYQDMVSSRDLFRSQDAAKTEIELARQVIQEKLPAAADRLTDIALKGPEDSPHVNANLRFLCKRFVEPERGPSEVTFQIVQLNEDLVDRMRRRKSGEIVEVGELLDEG